MKYAQEFYRDVGANYDAIRTMERMILPGGREIFEAATTGNLAELISLVTIYGQNVNAVGAVSRSPLHWAAMGGHADLVEFLAQHNATINAPDSRMWTPLHWASNNSHLEVVKILIRYKADTTRKTIDVCPSLWSFSYAL